MLVIFQLGYAGVITATTLMVVLLWYWCDINGDIDVDGHSNLDNVSILVLLLQQNTLVMDQD